jgi:hypothetical protein
MQPTAAEADVKALQADLQTVDAKIANLIAAVEQGGTLRPIQRRAASRRT